MKENTGRLQHERVYFDMVYDLDVCMIKISSTAIRRTYVLKISIMQQRRGVAVPEVSHAIKSFPQCLALCENYQVDHRRCS